MIWGFFFVFLPWYSSICPLHLSTSWHISVGELQHRTFLTVKSLSLTVALTGDHQGHRVSLIVVAHDDLTVVSAWVVGAQTWDLHGSVQRTGSVSWQPDTAAESLIQLDYITFGTGKKNKLCSVEDSSKSSRSTRNGEDVSHQKYY